MSIFERYVEESESEIEVIRANGLVVFHGGEEEQLDNVRLEHLISFIQDRAEIILSAHIYPFQ
jgi:hypothetical protein